MISSLFTTFGWSRDDAKWTVLIVLAVIIGLATISESMVTTLGLPTAILPLLPWCRLVALLVGIVSGMMKTSNLFAKGQVPADGGSIDVTKRLGVLWIVVAIGAGVTVSSCAAAALRTADGRLNVPVLLDWADAGIKADCAVGTGALAANLCTFGTDAITTARAVAVKNPTMIQAAVKQSLVDSETHLPPTSALRPYLDWLVNLL